MYWCFHCYALNDHPAGACATCGEPVEAPAGLSRVESLVWALGHPDGDRAVLAAGTLGRLKAAEAVPALRQAVETRADIFLREEALRSLLAIVGVEALRPWLEEMSCGDSFTVRLMAQEALSQNPHR